MLSSGGPDKEHGPHDAVMPLSEKRHLVQAARSER
jgi:hypothetical protein